MLREQRDTVTWLTGVSPAGAQYQRPQFSLGSSF